MKFLKHNLCHRACVCIALLWMCSLEAKQPNVLFIMIDDLRPELGCYGAPQVKTLSIDRLAADALVFERAYCNVPVCGASRASLMTSILPTRERFRQYDARADEDTPNAKTLPQVFKEAGYHTSAVGKVFHNREDSAAVSWSEPLWLPEVGSEYRFAIDPATTETLSKAGRGRIYEMPDVADDAYPDGKIALKTIETLRSVKDSEQPFFIACGFIRPHLPFYAPKKYWDLYDREAIEIAGNREKAKGAPDALFSGGEYNLYDHGEYKRKTEAFHQMMRHGYYASVSYVDQLVGDVLAELESLGLAEDTIVVLWGDHGWNLGEHEFWGKHNMAHNSLQVPLLIKVPGLEPHQRTSALVSSIDIFPTLCELAGLASPDAVHGQSFSNLMKRPNATHRDTVYTRFLDGDTVVNDRYAYTRYSGKRSGNMLYDLKNDPAETINIGVNPENAPIVEAMEMLLEQSEAEAAAY